MSGTLAQAFRRGFLGNAPAWYKRLVFAFLLANPILLVTLGPTVTGWAVLLEFIVTLAMALRCYPLQPGGLIALEAVLLGLTSAESAYQEVITALPVLLLLMFMVAGIYFLRDLLLKRLHGSAAAHTLFVGAFAHDLRRGRRIVRVSRRADRGRGARDRRSRLLRRLSPRRFG